ncbi:hypothetical protein PsYK624_098420 [Phanerochaete sordida]|uniref:Uncharacterized protein n=1 Tax=Phanerochaete sordida TaxID=48140 RepID=A0A9P3GDH1_9APHY|nr:hypothetical protein PsYK624_098420 [Phanerochaete sordida]
MNPGPVRGRTGPSGAQDTLWRSFCYSKPRIASVATYHSALHSRMRLSGDESACLRGACDALVLDTKHTTSKARRSRGMCVTLARI